MSWLFSRTKQRMTAWVDPRSESSSDVTRTSFRLHERPLACVDGSEHSMREVLSKTCSSMVVMQGNPFLAIDLCMPAAGCPTPLTLQPFPIDTINLFRRRLAASQAHWP